MKIKEQKISILSVFNRVIYWISCIVFTVLSTYTFYQLCQNPETPENIIQLLVVTFLCGLVVVIHQLKEFFKQDSLQLDHMDFASVCLRLERSQNERSSQSVIQYINKLKHKIEFIEDSISLSIEDIDVEAVMDVCHQYDSSLNRMRTSSHYLYPTQMQPFKPRAVHYN